MEQRTTVATLCLASPPSPPRVSVWCSCTQRLLVYCLHGVTWRLDCRRRSLRPCARGVARSFFFLAPTTHFSRAAFWSSLVTNCPRSGRRRRRSFRRCARGQSLASCLAPATPPASCRWYDRRSAQSLARYAMQRGADGGVGFVGHCRRAFPLIWQYPPRALPTLSTRHRRALLWYIAVTGGDVRTAGPVCVLPLPL